MKFTHPTEPTLYYPLSAQLLELMNIVLLSPTDSDKLKHELETFVLGCERVNHTKNDALQYFLNIAENFSQVVGSFSGYVKLRKLSYYSYADADDSEIIRKTFEILKQLTSTTVYVGMFDEQVQSIHFDTVFEISTMEFITIVAPKSRTGVVKVTRFHANQSTSLQLRRGETLEMDVAAAMFQVLAELGALWREHANH